MEKLFNDVSIVGGVVGGCVVALFGGYDTMLKVLLTLVVLDYVTGIFKAVATKTLSSEIGFKGLLSKITIFVVVAMSVTVEKVIGDKIPLREIVITFYSCNEGISLLENAAYFIPIPKKLKDALIQLRETTEEEGEKK